MRHRKESICYILKDELTKKTFDKITISEIVKIANLSRQNFYYYFGNLEDCLKFLLSLENPFKNNIKVNISSNIENIFTYYDNNKQFIDNIMQNLVSRNALVSCLYKDLNTITLIFMNTNIPEIIELSDEDIKILITYYSNAYLGLIINNVFLKKNYRRDIDMYAYLLNGEIRTSVLKLLTYRKEHNK